MMDLFSTFNPITSNHLSMNWIIIILPMMTFMIPYWNLNSYNMIISKMFLNNIYNQFKSSMNMNTKPNLNIIITIMSIIMIYNLFSLLPNTFSVTTHIMFNISMALIMWINTMMKKVNNMTNLMAHLTPSNTPFILIPFMVLIELISLLIQPMTLSIRLTANIMAGHIMMVLISQLYSLTIIPTLFMNLIMLMMELGVSIIQAYVFSMLILMYSK